MKSPKNAETYFDLDEGNITNHNQKPKGNMTWPQILDFIGESNFNFIWEQPQISLLGNHDSESQIVKNNEGTSKSIATMEAHLYLNKLIRKLYINLGDGAGRSRGDDGENIEVERFPVSGLSQALLIITKSIETAEKVPTECFLLFHQYMDFSLHDAVTFSPQKLTSTSRQMFIVYQILNFLRDFQTTGLPLGGLSLDDFKIDESLYLNVIPWISGIYDELKTNSDDKNSGTEEVVDSKVIAKLKSIVNKVRGWDNDPKKPSAPPQDCQIDPKFVETVIRYWCEGLVSNYEYIMFLNFLCGRYCSVNPNFYPVFPWVSHIQFSITP